MPPQIFCHPWVYSATKTERKIRFRVDVSDFLTTQGAIEITGQATQVNGAFAPITRIINIADAVMGDPDDEDEVNRYFVDVEAVPIPGHPFRDDLEITVFVRVSVSKMAVTVLAPGTDELPLLSWATI
jgi:hypothetical protein